MEIKDTPQLNLKPIELNSYGFQAGEEPQFNMAVASDTIASNVVSGAGGSVLTQGTLISPNYKVGTTGWKLDSNGDIEASNGTFRGTITAATGTIGKWNINATSIYTGTEDHSGYTANAGDMTIYSDGSDASIHAKNFYIDTNGNLVCTNATITGVLTAAASSNIDFAYVAGTTKPADNATVGAVIGTNLTGGSTADNTINNSGVITNLKAQHIIAPSDFTAGEAITAGDALYFKASDSKVYKADTDADESTYNFIGFARDSYGNGDTDAQVITGGIITKAAWGLTAGTWYYLSGTAGAVSSTPGTRVLEVGIALSATELLIIQRKPRQAAGSTTLAATNTATITIGFRPTHVILFSRSTAITAHCTGFGDSVTNSCTWYSESVTSELRGTEAWYFKQVDAEEVYGVVDTFTATGFRLNQTVNNITGGSTTSFLWIAWG